MDVISCGVWHFRSTTTLPSMGDIVLIIKDDMLANSPGFKKFLPGGLIDRPCLNLISSAIAPQIDYSRNRNFRPNLFFSPIIDVFFPKINPTISPQPDYWITSGNLKGVSVDSEKVSWTSGPSISFCLLWFMNNKFSRIIFRNPGPN
jgi:hypothetical protein